MRFILVTVAVVALSACGGSDDDGPLVLSSGTYSEDEYRTSVRAALSRPGSEDLCRSLKGLSDREITELAVQAQKGSFTPVQGTNDASQDRASQILREECERVF